MYVIGPLDVSRVGCHDHTDEALLLLEVRREQYSHSPCQSAIALATYRHATLLHSARTVASKKTRAPGTQNAARSLCLGQSQQARVREFFPAVKLFVPLLHSLTRVERLRVRTLSVDFVESQLRLIRLDFKDSTAGRPQVPPKALLK